MKHITDLTNTMRYTAETIEYVLDTVGSMCEDIQVIICSDEPLIAYRNYQLSPKYILHLATTKPVRICKALGIKYTNNLIEFDGIEIYVIKRRRGKK